MHRRLLPVIRASLLAICALHMGTIGCHSSRPAGAVPDFSLRNVRGDTFRLHSQPSGPVLLAFLQTVPDTADTPSRSQAVFVASMNRQYGNRGLRVAVIDATALVNHHRPDLDALVNASYDWQMNFPLLEDPDNDVAQRFGVREVPTLVLVAPDGKISQRWQGLTRPAPLAQGIERLLGGPLGRLPDLT